MPTTTASDTPVDLRVCGYGPCSGTPAAGRPGVPAAYCSPRHRAAAARDRQSPEDRAAVAARAAARHLTAMEQPIPARTCEECRAEWQPLNRRPARYCPGCREVRRYPRREVTCGHCGRVAMVSGPAPRFCGRSCGATATARRTAAGPRRTREYAAPGLNQRRRLLLLAKWRRQGRTCSYCPRPADTADHVVPLILGGTNYEGNLTPCCRRCNGSKRDRLLIVWRVMRTT